MTSTLGIATLAAVGLLVCGLPARTLAAQATARTLEPELAARPVQLEVDVGGLSGYEGFDPAIYDTMMQQALSRALESRGVEQVDEGADGADRVRIGLVWRDFDASVYEVEVAVTRAGGRSRTLPSQLCEYCTDDELVAKAESQLDAALEVLAKAEPQEPVETDPGDGGTVVADPPVVEEPSERRGLAPLAGVGIGVVALGAGGLITGGVLLGRDDRVGLAPDGGLELETTSYRPPAIGLVVGGGVLLAAGVTLIAVGQLRHGKRRDSEGSEARGSSRRFTWSPAAGPDGVSLRLSGRF